MSTEDKPSDNLPNVSESEKDRTYAAYAELEQEVESLRDKNNEIKFGASLVCIILSSLLLLPTFKGGTGELIIVGGLLVVLVLYLANIWQISYIDKIFYADIVFA